MQRKARIHAVSIGLTVLLSATTTQRALAQNPEAKETPQAVAEAEDKAAERAFDLTVKEWKGDFDGMLERRAIRILVPYSRTLYYSDKGRERGVTAENIRDFEQYLNAKYKKQLGNRPITIVALPTTRDLLLSNVDAGKGDI